MTDPQSGCGRGALAPPVASGSMGFVAQRARCDRSDRGDDARSAANGLTYLELLISVGIIGLLAMISANVYVHALEKSKLTRAIVDIRSIESALVDHQDVAEAAVVGCHDEIKGTAIAAFVTMKSGIAQSPDLEDELKAHVVKKIGAIARPSRIIFSGDLPKTRSGKIMRRLLRDIADGRVLGDTTTLADSSVVDSLKRQYEEQDED